ncbi:glyoxalase [Leptospira semungkisensis]|uniref:Glyoxalase n=1 Tax=Leptospira semungkisensis TaxID=2484985 RepID=A0A4R9GA91_9LEPT|nr:VOC family protein [Leptospira semungkisensis]TGK07827.1 glyoxalase [Leptospira semungkisensis]
MIHHIAISTEDPQRLKQFYEKIPGLVFEKDHFFKDGELRSSWFLAGNIRLMIEKEPIKKAPFALVFSASSPEERKKIELDFGDILKEETDYTKYFLDPDGNRLGFSSYPERWN